MKPIFYDDFQCSANQCPFTCCQQWKISVDEETRSSWEHMTASCVKGNLSNYIIKKDGDDVIALEEDGFCPFMRENGLCNLVIEHGDDALSETCQIFPRQSQEFENGWEQSLVVCCPEVVDILSQLESFEMVDYPEKMSQEQEIRELLARILKEEKYSVNQALHMVFYVLRDIWKQGKYVAKEYEESELCQLAEAIEDLECDLFDTLGECYDLFYDVVSNYRKEGLYPAFLEPLLQEAEKWEQKLETAEAIESWQAFCSELNAYEKWIRNYLLDEIYADLLRPDSNYESMLVALQWIILEYAVTRQAWFYQWRKEGALIYEDMRMAMVCVARMTGYREEDIIEYFQGFFDGEVIWKWGYFRLVMGGDVSKKFR